ncbi:phytoene desaturase [Crocosphaera sp. Alani8]|uniref:phytoene desaturase n=1 Tax=Crocosphaera sp. Alani8 TaxID=3038952 RepID=UPI00313D99D9
MKIIVIGSGFGGLSVAIRLAATSHQVTLIEKRDQPGGRAYVYQQDGFTFDGGPTIITVPYLIDELFSLAGKDRKDYLNLVPLDPFYNVRFPNGEVFHYNNDADGLIEQIREFNPDDVKGYYKLKEASDKIFKAGLPLMAQPFHQFWDMVKVAPDLIRLQTYKSVAGFVNQYLKDEKLRQVFSFHPLLIGGNPFETTSIYAMIHKLEQEFGIWFPLGGTGALVKAFVKLFQNNDGKLLLNREVKQIAIDSSTRRAKGVYLDHSEFLDADIVVSNADVAFTYLNLIPAQYRKKWSDRSLKKLRYSMSLFVFYFGTDIQYPQMAHHEVLLGQRYRPWIEDIFKQKILPDDFCLYLHHPTITDPTLAPVGCDSWYVLAPVPNLQGQINWKRKAQEYRNRIVDYLEKHYLPNLSQHIVTEHYIDPPHFQNTLNSYNGSAFSVEPTLTQSAWFRPHNQSEDIENLYFVGAGTHPGAGLPGVLNSGKIVAHLIEEKEHH